MSADQPHRVLLRYDREDDRDAFLQDFAGAFSIDSYSSDQEALAAIARGRSLPDALVFITTDTDQLLTSSLLQQVSDGGCCLRIVIGGQFSLDQIIHLLENRVVDRCYAKPWDINLVRTDLFAATMSVQDNAGPTPVESEHPKPLVLIVDDEQSATKYLSKQLMRMQDRFETRCAASAQQALETLHQEGHRTAVLMTDQRMPGMKGLQLINEMRQSYPHITRILTSAYGELDVALGAVNQGRIFRYQKKPWHAASLLPVLDDAIAQHHASRQKSEQWQFALAERFEGVRERRKAALLRALTESPSVPWASRDVIQNFLRDMDAISTLPPGASHFRDHSPEALDNALVRGLRAELTRYLEIPLTDAVPNNGTLPDAIQSALDVLLSASGMSRDHLISEQDEDVTTLRLEAGKNLHLYSHVLSPMARVSSQLLKQQGALLALYIMAQQQGGQVLLQGGQQRFTLELSLPLRAPSGGSRQP